jgi:hypothetical protein
MTVELSRAGKIPESRRRSIPHLKPERLDCEVIGRGGRILVLLLLLGKEYLLGHSLRNTAHDRRLAKMAIMLTKSTQLVATQL